MFNYSTPISPGSTTNKTWKHKLFAGVYALVVWSVHVLVNLQVEFVSSILALTFLCEICDFPLWLLTYSFTEAVTLD